MQVGDNRWRVEWASAIDLWQICRLERLVFQEPLTWRGALGQWLRPKVGYLVVRDGRQIVAYFGFEVQGPVAHVLANVTAPSHQRRGLAHVILEAGQVVARTWGARLVMGEVRSSNRKQMRVLEHLGWHAVGQIRQFFGNGEDAIVYMKIFDA
jgi:ribosomal protein S18 acetylase RimI-like enzyme